MISIDELQLLIARELAWIELPERRAALEAVLVEPRLEEREWDYGAPGEKCSYWVVAEAPDNRLILVWCDEGFGPTFPWGFLSTIEPHDTSLGMDSQWSCYLEEAFVRSGLSGERRKMLKAWDVAPGERRPPSAKRLKK